MLPHPVSWITEDNFEKSGFPAMKFIMSKIMSNYQYKHNNLRECKNQMIQRSRE